MLQNLENYGVDEQHHEPHFDVSVQVKLIIDAHDQGVEEESEQVNAERYPDQRVFKLDRLADEVLLLTNVNFNLHLHGAHAQQNLKEGQPCAEANQPDLLLELPLLLVQSVFIDVGDPFFPALVQIENVLLEHAITKLLRTTLGEEFIR